MDNDVYEYRVTVQYEGIDPPTGWEEAEPPTRNPEHYKHLVEQRNARTPNTHYRFRLERAPAQQWEPLELATSSGVPDTARFGARQA